MATDTLVEEAIDGGAKLLERLQKEGFPVEAAFWLKNSEDGEWYFYIASPAVDDQSMPTAYRTVYRIMQSLETTGFWVLKSDVKLLGMNDPVTRDVLNIKQSYPGKNPIRYRGRQLGKIVIDEAYLYPLPV